MGIKQLFKTISENCPCSVKEQTLKGLTGKTIVIDASMCMYQFLIAMGSNTQGGDSYHTLSLTNDKGEPTAHLTGFVSRTLKLMEAGIKPIYVFDGKPPPFKTGELKRRQEVRQKAQVKADELAAAGDTEGAAKAGKSTIRASKQMTEDVKRLIQAMGVQIVNAEGEAEAECADMVKRGLADGTATEDMDVLTFGCPVMYKNLFNSMGSGRDGSKKEHPVYEIHLDLVLTELEMDMNQFVHFCILCGCDYLPTVKGVGPGNALKLIKKEGTIRAVLGRINREKYSVPQELELHHEIVTRYFIDPSSHQVDESEMKNEFGLPENYKCDYIESDMHTKKEQPHTTNTVPGPPSLHSDVFRAILIDENQFNEDRVSKYITRLEKCTTGTRQMRLDHFIRTKAPDKSTILEKSHRKRRSTVVTSGVCKKLGEVFYSTPKADTPKNSGEHTHQKSDVISSLSTPCMDPGIFPVLAKQEFSQDHEGNGLPSVISTKRPSERSLLEGSKRSRKTKDHQKRNSVSTKRSKLAASCVGANDKSETDSIQSGELTAKGAAICDTQSRTSHIGDSDDGW